VTGIPNISAASISPSNGAKVKPRAPSAPKMNKSSLILPQTGLRSAVLARLLTRAP
jgi:hypothetical protein